MSKKELEIIPGQGKIIVSANKEATTKGGIIIAGGKGFEYLELQRVIAIGADVPKYIMEDDIIKINVNNYKILRYSENTVKADINGNYTESYNLPIEVIDGKEYMLLNAFSDIKYLYPINDEHFTKEELLEKQNIIVKTEIIK